MCITVFIICVGNCTGNQKAHFPYAKVESYGITINGLPDDIQLKHPSSYGREKLERIIANEDRLSLESTYSIYMLLPSQIWYANEYLGM